MMDLYHLHVESRMSKTVAVSDISVRFDGFDNRPIADRKLTRGFLLAVCRGHDASEHHLINCVDADQLMALKRNSQLEGSHHPPP